MSVTAFNRRRREMAKAKQREKAEAVNAEVQKTEAGKPKASPKSKK